MSEAAATHCPNCNGANPVGAKFCSACRATLGTAAPGPSPMAPPPPPPPPRPGIGGMMGQMGGKAVTRQITGDAGAVYAELASYVRGLPSTEIQQEAPPQQLTAHVAYKDFVATGGIVIAIDTSITVAPTSPGQCQVSVTTKTDMSSTNKIWIYNLFFAVCGLFLLPFVLPVSLIVIAIALVISFWMISTMPGQNVSNQMFEHLRKVAPKLTANSSAGATAAAAAATVSASSPPSSPPNSPSSNSTAESKPAATAGTDEDEVFARLKKLAELRDAGAISDEDFEAKKADLLARI
ncbi:MAG: SHOCT domain-containing protein [Pseudomonadales bacterium]